MPTIKKISFAHVGRKEGCTCDKCGQYIQNIVTVDYGDGVRLHYGQDCFSNLCNGGKLNAYGVKLMRKTLKSIETHSRELESYVSGKKTAENDVVYGYDQQYGGCWKGKPFEEYRKWMIEVWFPKIFEGDQKEIDRFSKINFDI